MAVPVQGSTASPVILDPWSDIIEVGWNTKQPVALLMMTAFFFEEFPEERYGVRVRYLKTTPAPPAPAPVPVVQSVIGCINPVNVNAESDPPGYPSFYLNGPSYGTSIVPPFFVPMPGSVPAGADMKDYSHYYAVWENGLFTIDNKFGSINPLPMRDLEDDPGLLDPPNTGNVGQYFGHVRSYCLVNIAKLIKDFGPLAHVYIDLMGDTRVTAGGYLGAPASRVVNYRVYNKVTSMQGAAGRTITNNGGMLLVDQNVDLTLTQTDFISGGVIHTFDYATGLA